MFWTRGQRPPGVSWQRRRPRHALLLAITAASLALPAAAHATFPGLNGPLAYPQGGANPSDPADLFKIDPDGSDKVRLTDTDGIKHDHPAWSPDGTRIAFDRSNPSRDSTDVFVMTVHGGQTTRITRAAPGTHDSDPAWSPDGTRLVFASDRVAGTSTIWVTDADGENPTQLTETGPDLAPDWSPDGTQIAFSSERSPGDGIWVMESTGLVETPLTAGTDFAPSWAPDSQRIAYLHNDLNGNSIRAVDRDGTDPGLLYNAFRCGMSGPSWSPNGKRIAFALGCPGECQASVMVLTFGERWPESLRGRCGQSRQGAPSWKAITP